MNAISANDTDMTAATNADPLVALVAGWKVIFQAWEDETATPGAGDGDTPECLRLEALREALTVQIEATKPRTMEGVVALAEFLWICDGGDYSSEYVSCKKSVFRNIMESLRPTLGCSGGEA